MSFVEDVLSGRADLADVDKCREAWDASDVDNFHDFLGLLWPEYAMWVEEGDIVLDYVIKARRQGTNLKEFLADGNDHGLDSAKLARLVERYADEWAAENT